MGWIKSDPRGYIEVARQVNLANNDFRKSAKFVKAWKWACKELNDMFKLKSFHMEQIITAYFQRSVQLDIYDAVFQFFRDLPKLIERAQIPDRADGSVNIDQYVDDLTDAEKRLIIQARNTFLSKLENFNVDSDVKDLIEAGFAVQPVNTSGPAIITATSPAITSVRPRSPSLRIMLSREDSVWLAREYPELRPAPYVVKVLLKFTGAYHEKSGRFFIVNDEPAHAELGTVLSGAFEIRIRGRLDFEATTLPRLFVDGVPPTLDNHFYQNDFSACLCSPLQHEDFLIPEFQFRRFFNELVVPFLYGQVFLSIYGKWPWAEFAHGATGILEAYASSNGRRKTQKCVGFLAQDHNWPGIKSILLEESQLDANLQCFCRSGRIIGRCHPQALRGAQLLQKDLRYWPIPLP